MAIQYENNCCTCENWGANIKGANNSGHPESYWGTCEIDGKVTCFIDTCPLCSEIGGDFNKP